MAGASEADFGSVGTAASDSGVRAAVSVGRADVSALVVPPSGGASASGVRAAVSDCPWVAASGAMVGVVVATGWFCAEATSACVVLGSPVRAGAAGMTFGRSGSAPEGRGRVSSIAFSAGGGSAKRWTATGDGLAGAGPVCVRKGTAAGTPVIGACDAGPSCWATASWLCVTAGTTFASLWPGVASDAGRAEPVTEGVWEDAKEFGCGWRSVRISPDGRPCWTGEGSPDDGWTDSSGEGAPPSPGVEQDSLSLL